MNSKQLREVVIRPVLRYLGPEIPYSETAVELLVMTAAHESLMGEYLVQINGPAQGIYQMEEATENDIWQNYLEYREELGDLVRGVRYKTEVQTPLVTLETAINLAYATAMARVHYFRDSRSLPRGSLSDESTIWELAEFAKDVWATYKGKASVEDYFNAYMKEKR